MSLTIELFAPNVYDNLICTSAAFTADEIDYLTEDGTLSWENFPNADIICNYQGSINSSYLMPEAGSITGYEIQRKENGKDYWTTIYSDTYENFYNKKSGENFIVRDYNIRNNTKYTYRIYSLTEDAFNSYIEGEVITYWEIFVLMPLIENYTDKYNTDNIKADPIFDKNGKPKMWCFWSNCEEQAFTKIQDKTVFDTFTKYPKISMGETNYFNISFTGLLGSFNDEGEYYEPLTMLDEWNEFVNLSLPCIYKNLKGETKLVFIDTDSTNTFNNYYLNYYKDEDDFITNRPTTISCNLVEIGEANKISLCKVGE